QLLVIEGPEVLDRSATTADDHDIHAGNATDEVEAAPQVSRSIVTLHPRWPDDDVRVGVAAGQYFQDVAHGRAVERRHDADLPGQRGQRPLAGRIEQAFGLQSFLRLIE